MRVEIILLGSSFDVFQYNSTNITGQVKAAAAAEAVVVEPSQVGFWNISGVFLSSSSLYWKTGKEVPLSSTNHISSLTLLIIIII